MLKRLFLVILVLFAFVNISFAKDYTVKKLSNGQTVIVKEVHDNPIVTVDTWIKTGSINENDKNNGVAHFLEHMFFKGTQNYPAGKFEQILESKGAITNAATSKDYTHYYIEIPSKYFDLAMELHSDMLLNPLLPRNELEMERKVVLEEIARGNDNIEKQLYEQLISSLYKEHPYKREVIGTNEVIETITREEMLNFYNEWYNPSNMITVVVGDVDTNKVIKSVENNFKSNKKNLKKKVAYKHEHIQTNLKPAVINTDTKSGYLIIGFRGVTPKEVNDSAALDVLATILGNGKSSRLYKNIQEEKHLCSSIYSGHSSLKDDSIFLVKAIFSPENQEKLETEIWKQIQILSEKEISQDELEKAKNIIKRDTLYSRESVSNIANELGYLTVLTGSPSYYDNYLKDIEKVNADDVVRVANKYLDFEKAGISYVLPKDTTLKTVSYSKEKSQSLTFDNKIKNEEKLTVKNYPQTELQTPVSEYKNTKKYVLPNGLTLLVTKNTANDIIAINMLSKGGFFQEISTSKRGSGQLLADLIMKGTKNLSLQDINDIIDENGIEISSKMTPDAMSVSLKLTQDEIPVTLSLFDELINNATLDEKFLADLKKEKLQKIAADKDAVSTLAFDEMKYLMWENTPYQNSYKFMEKSYNDVTISDIKALYSQIYDPQNTIVSVNGNIDERLLINYFSDVFKNKKCEKFDINEHKKEISPIKNDKFSEVIKNSNQSWIIYAYRTPALENKKDWAALKVIDTILGSGMSSRLFYTLREQQGLAYAVASAYQSNTLQGLFVTYIGTNPKNLELAKNGMAEEIKKLKMNFVTSKELEQAKEQLFGNYLLALETNSDKASVNAMFELQGRGFDFDKDYFELINSVTEQDIIEVANKYFSAPMVTVIVK